MFYAIIPYLLKRTRIVPIASSIDTHFVLRLGNNRLRIDLPKSINMHCMYSMYPSNNSL